VPMIDVYAAAGTFAGMHLLAVDLAAQRGGDLCGRGAVGGDGEGVAGLQVQGHPAGPPPPRAGRYRLAQPGVIATADRAAPRLHR
jgi:hypothetical protein